MNFTETLQSLTGKPLSACTNQELYLALLELVRRKSADRVQPVTGRKLYYISAEFLIGKLLSNNLINLGLYDEARDALRKDHQAFFPCGCISHNVIDRMPFIIPTNNLLNDEGPSPVA